MTHLVNSKNKATCGAVSVDMTNMFTRVTCPECLDKISADFCKGKIINNKEREYVRSFGSYKQSKETH